MLKAVLQNLLVEIAIQTRFNQEAFNKNSYQKHCQFIARAESVLSYNSQTRKHE